jgi:hypothetical protein
MEGSTHSPADTNTTELQEQVHTLTATRDEQSALITELTSENTKLADAHNALKQAAAEQIDDLTVQLEKANKPQTRRTRKKSPEAEEAVSEPVDVEQPVETPADTEESSTSDDESVDEEQPESEHMSLVQLRKEAKRLNLKISGNVSDLARRVQAAKIVAQGRKADLDPSDVKLTGITDPFAVGDEESAEEAEATNKTPETETTEIITNFSL